MGAGTSKKDDDTSIRDATTRGPITFDDATLHFVKGGPPPPPSETSTRLQPQWNEAFMRLTQKAREKQASRAMSTKEALDAFKGKFGESAFVEAFGDEDKYLKSIVRPVTVTGTSSKLWHLGPREYVSKSEHAQEIQATAAQRTGAAVLAPSGAGGVVALEGEDDARRWAGLTLVSSSAERDGDLNYWEGFVNSGAKPFQTLLHGGDWSGAEVLPEWDDLIKSPSGRKPPNRPRGWYRGPLARTVTSQSAMTKDACGNDATMLDHWDRATFYAQRLAAILKEERKAFEAMRDMGNAGGGRASRAPRQSYRPEDDNAALTRTKTEELRQNNPTLWHERHHGALKDWLSRNEELLEAIAKEVDVPRSVLTGLDKDERAYVLAPFIKVDLPGLGPNLVKTNWDHVALRWIDGQRAIYLLGLRGLIWGKLNKMLPGYEWYMARAAERTYFEGYLKRALCFDSSIGKHWVFEFPVEDEPKWWRRNVQRQQQKEMYFIMKELKGVLLGATQTGADAAWNSST